MESNLKILQITDMHLFSDKNATLLGLNTFNQFSVVIEDIGHLKTNPNLIIFTGDISQDYTERSYLNFIEACLPLKNPTVAILGNHDNPTNFYNVLKDSNIASPKTITLDNWKLIFLNSHWPNHIAGYLQQKELDFLQQEISNTNNHIAIFLHHHVLATNSEWLNQHVLQNADAFLNLIKNNTNIKFVSCGHIHQEFLEVWHNITFLATPATCWQFAIKSLDFKLDTLMPGYRFFDLYDNGEFKTEIIRLPYNPKFVPDLSSKGY